MLTITGGKLTTWRRMAKMTSTGSSSASLAEASCRTHEIRSGRGIVGVGDLPRVEGVPEPSYAGAGRSLWLCRARVRALATRSEIDGIDRPAGRAGAADRPRPARPARRGRARRAARAGALDRGRASAPHPPGAAGRARTACGAGGGRACARASLEPRAHRPRDRAVRAGGRRGGDSRGFGGSSGSRRGHCCAARTGGGRAGGELGVRGLSRMYVFLDPVHLCICVNTIENVRAV